MAQYHTLTGALAASACLLCAAPLARAASVAAIDVVGRGVQIYTCAPGPAGFAWRFKAPRATLTDRQGHVFGHHSAGPVWQANDGSAVTGEAIESNAGADGAVPWLLLRAKSHAGQGTLSAVSTIVRSHTEGGLAPATGCDAPHAGQTLGVDYSAEYIFFSSSTAKP